MKMKFSCEVTYGNFQVPCRAVRTAPLCNKEDMPCILCRITHIEQCYVTDEDCTYTGCVCHFYYLLSLK